MSTGPFVSFAQNGEDVVLWRALGHVTEGCYVDVGAFDPVSDSVTKAFYERGWRGVDVEPTPEMADALRKDRPRDEVVEAAVSTTSERELILHRVRFPGGEAELTGLSTLQARVAGDHERQGWTVEDITVPVVDLTSVCDSLGGRDIHFLKVDVEGTEADVLRSLDLQSVRPWVMVVEATRPDSTEPSHEEWEPLLLDNGYELCLFDGLSRFYSAVEHPELRERLSYPACVFDDYVTAREQGLRVRLEAAEGERSRLWDDVVSWRAMALDGWSTGFGKVADLEAQVQRLQKRLRVRNQQARELRERVDRMGGSASWRVTRPLRAVRSRVGRSDPEAPPGTDQ